MENEFRYAIIILITILLFCFSFLESSGHGCLFLFLCFGGRGIASKFHLCAEHPWLLNAKKAPNVPLGDVVKPRLKQFSLMNRFKRKALRDGLISYEAFAAMMKTGTNWRKASRHYSRGRFNSLSVKLMKDGSLNLGKE